MRRAWTTPCVARTPSAPIHHLVALIVGECRTNSSVLASYVAVVSSSAGWEEEDEEGEEG